MGRAREGGREEVVVSRRSSRTRASGEAAPAVVAVAFCYRRLPCCTCRVDQSRRTFVCSQRARTVIGGPEQRARNLRVVGAPFLECRRRFWAPRSTCFCLAPLSWFMPQRLLLFLFCFLILFFCFMAVLSFASGSRLIYNLGTLWGFTIFARCRFC